GKTHGAGWSEIPVRLRADILAAAEREHIDIADICNAALAYRLGMSCLTPGKEPALPEIPIIIAPNAGRPDIPHENAARHQPPAPAVLPAVINADDPTAPARVLKEKKTKKPAAPAAVPGPLPKPHPSPSEASGPSPDSTSPSVAQKPVPKPKKQGKKEDAIKRFVSTRIVRETEESAEAIIGKDELYQRFERWCREHDYSSVPDRRAFTVALKNRYAIFERSIGGEPSWVGIRIK
ncbi:MAG: hypothetical protein LUQ31_05345, partial [Methanoregula sp.]|nr:hypothetical protein [Methanoregula sp.]